MGRSLRQASQSYAKKAPMFDERIKSQVQSHRDDGTYRFLQHTLANSFVDNDYLGLRRDPRLVEGAIGAMREFGVGSGGSRLLGGQNPLFENLEENIAHFFGAPNALFFSTGYLANLAIVSVLSKLSKRIVSDQKNHASLIDGIRLSKTACHVYEHGRPPAFQDGDLVVSETLFSMDGDLVDLTSLLHQASSKDVFVILDEAHAAGVIGPSGHGLSEFEKVSWDRTALTVTFGKAFGAAGAAIVCSDSLKELLINEARSFIYTTAPSPAVAGALIESLKVVSSEGYRREKLWSLALQVNEIVGDLRCTPVSSFWEARTPIIPVSVPSEALALRLAENMRESGIDVRAIRYPTVARGAERIRVSLNLNTSEKRTLEMARELVKLCRKN